MVSRGIFSLSHISFSSPHILISIYRFNHSFLMEHGRPTGTYLHTYLLACLLLQNEALIHSHHHCRRKKHIFCCLPLFKLNDHNHKTPSTVLTTYSYITFRLFSTTIMAFYDFLLDCAVRKECFKLFCSKSLAYSCMIRISYPMCSQLFADIFEIETYFYVSVSNIGTKLSYTTIYYTFCGLSAHKC